MFLQNNMYDRAIGGIETIIWIVFARQLLSTTTGRVCARDQQEQVGSLVSSSCKRVSQSGHTYNLFTFAQITFIFRQRLAFAWQTVQTTGRPIPVGQKCLKPV